MARSVRSQVSQHRFEATGIKSQHCILILILCEALHWDAAFSGLREGRLVPSSYSEAHGDDKWHMDGWVTSMEPLNFRVFVYSELPLLDVP